MDVNSEAIYNTRAIAPYKEGKVALTQNRYDKTVYAIYLADEDEKVMPSKIWLSTFTPVKGVSITMLGKREKLEWEQIGNGFIVTIPEKWRKNPPCKNAWVIKIVSK